MTDIDTEQTQRPLRRRGRPVGTTRKTPAEVSQNQREASSRWYNNHEYRCNQQKKYCEENRDRRLEKRRQHKNVIQ